MKLFSTITATVILAAIEVLALSEQDLGCYEFGTGKLVKEAVLDNNSRGECMALCREKKKPLAAMGGGSTCYCGSQAPAVKVKKDKCDLPCPAYDKETCGSLNGMYINVHYTGQGAMDPPAIVSTTSSTTSSAKPTSTGSSPSETASETSEPTNEPKKSSGVSKAGVAAGVVVGVLAAVALVGGSILFYKRRRQQKVEEEYRRTLAVQSFGKKPEADHRLEPVMLQRRASDGSIADNEDYSRRILKVTNPDG